MSPKILVLRREKRIDQRLGEISKAQLDAAFTRIGIDDLAIDPAHHTRQRRLIINQAIRRGQVAQHHQPDQQIDRQNGPKHNRPDAKPAVGVPVA